MSDRATNHGKALSLMIVSLLALAGVLGFALSAAPGARAESCGQSNPYVSTDWTVSSAETCSGIMFFLDGNLAINAGGSLTVTGGGITFVQDTGHIHTWSIATGGTMTLINSTVTSSTNTLNPYVKIAVAVGGTLNARSGSVLKFPGSITLNSGSVLNMTASTITGFSDTELNGLGTGPWIDDNDDSPILTMSSATAYFFQSRIEKVYENIYPGMTAENITLTGSTMYAYDTYIGVDFTNNWQIHNVLALDTNSHAYFYNVTTDEAQSAQTPQYQQLPAMVPAGNGLIDILRWMDAKATDPYGTTLPGSTIWSHVGSATAQYPDNSNLLVPNARTLWYLGKTASNWNTTGASGIAVIPLWTDRITSTSLPNAITFGSYEATATFNVTYVATSSTTFPPYPSISQVDNTQTVAIALPVQGLTPDLTISTVVISGGNGISDFQPLNTPVTISATIHNSGQNPVSNVVVNFFSTNVDGNHDGVMDSPVSAYLASGVFIANLTIASVPANGDATSNAPWNYRGSFETGITVSVVVNPPLGDPSGPSAIPETNLKNDIVTHAVSLFVWPDLSIVSTTDVQFPSEPVANNDIPVQVTIRNIGTGGATAALVSIRDGTVQVSNTVSFNVGTGGTAHVEVTWHPTTEGFHNITFLVVAANNSIRNRDYNFTNNVLRVQVFVVSQPDLALSASDYTALTETQNIGFPLRVHIYNYGQTAVQNTSVAVYVDGDYTHELGRADGVSVAAETNVTVQVQGIPTPGAGRVLNIVVNPDRTLVEGGQGFANNYANVSLTVLPPSGRVILYSPSGNPIYGPTDAIFVQGVVQDRTSAQNGIAGLNVTIAVMSGTTVVQSVTQTTDANGLFTATVTLQDLADGQYSLQVSSPQGDITSYALTISVKRNVPFLNSPVPLLGIPWWLFLIIIAIVAGIVIAITVYFKVYGLGKMVECGECGAFIPEDATVCPKCGVEFEKDMAKCSNCQAWIPVDVKQCPECGVEFATGQVEMADYQEKMRLQYDEVVQKFKEDASRQLGRALSDKEFQEWWRKQPTFLTFEDWLREEEEMRKMGSRPCPVCGTLNSVTATVCHKCGSLMKEQRPPSGGPGAGGMAPPRRQAAAPAPAAPPSEQPGGPQAAGGQDMTRRVIRRPVTPAPVVQKKVIKRPLGEGEQADQGTDQTSGTENQGDEL